MFGHPKGLRTLFFTELWERLSYYGMRAILTLFLVDQVENGGFGLDDRSATAIYGLYTAMVYLVALPGGWIADRILGMQRSVLIGGIVIACGHFSMAVPTVYTFYLGLVLIVVGTGLLKPNISAIVGELYPEGGERRDAGFSIYYMGINIGALVGPLVCGWLGEEINWHLGFSAAGIGMVFGLIQYQLGRSNLNQAGLDPRVSSEEKSRATRQLGLGVAGFLLVCCLLLVLRWTGVWILTVSQFLEHFGILIALLTLGYFGWQFLSPRWNADEKRRIGAILILVMAATVFWAGFEQAGSSMTLFAETFTHRSLPDWTTSISGLTEIPAAWFQSINPFYIIVLAPGFSWFWVRLQHMSPSIPVKLGSGLMLLALGFVILGWGAMYTGDATREDVEAIPEMVLIVSPNWLIVTYLLHTMGELCLSPIGLSSVTKLSPKPLVGQMMGMWFMGAALGNLLAGMIAGLFGSMERYDLFWFVAFYSGLFGMLIAGWKPLRKLFSGIR